MRFEFTLCDIYDDNAIVRLMAIITPILRRTGLSRMVFSGKPRFADDRDIKNDYV